MSKTKTAAMQQNYGFSTRIILTFKPIFLQPEIRNFFGWQIKLFLVENDFGRITERNQNFYGFEPKNNQNTTKIVYGVQATQYEI